MPAEAQPEKENPVEPTEAPATMPMFIPAAFRDGWAKKFAGGPKDGKRKRFHGAAVIVFLIYVSRANAEGIAWPGIESLCVDTGLSRNAVKSAKKFLIDIGLLEVVKQERRKLGLYGKAVVRVKSKF